LTREERKLLGYFSRLDDADQEIILEILRKSIRVNRTIWSAYCFTLIKRLDEAERRETNTIDLFDDSASLKKQIRKPDRPREQKTGEKKEKPG
jgi:TRAP-type C4-dicarboxylate transport system substrate-binding protein